jgi:hypothetical protein
MEMMDTLTLFLSGLYSGSQHNAVDHLTIVTEHGFDYSVVRAPLIISDGWKSQNIS